MGMFCFYIVIIIVLLTLTYLLCFLEILYF